MGTTQPIIVIVGQTASGKSALAMTVARDFNGEIIAADSRTVYKGMDIGTAKPSVQDRSEIKHHFLDLIEPTKKFSAAEFKKYAAESVTAIQARGNLPIIVGGTGLYIDGYIYDFEFGPKAEQAKRNYLASLSLNELQSMAGEEGLVLTNEELNNPRHLARAIERGGVYKNHKAKPNNVLIIGLEIIKEQLDARIESRVDTMFDSGLAEEVQSLISLHGTDAPGLNTSGYKELKDGGGRDEVIRSHKYLAKRQRTWFRRNKDIHWMQNEQQAYDYVSDFLRKFATI